MEKRITAKTPLEKLRCFCGQPYKFVYWHKAKDKPRLGARCGSRDCMALWLAQTDVNVALINSTHEELINLRVIKKYEKTVQYEF